MANEPTQWPLSWPAGVHRTEDAKRENGRFKTAYTSARDNVIASLRGLERDSGKPVRSPILSSNIDLMGRLSPNDPGISLWFTFDNMPVAMAIDRFTTPAANCQALHHILEARRVEVRFANVHMVRQTFMGFRALAAPKSVDWKSILRFGPAERPTKADIEAAYRAQAKEAHPDKPGGSEALMAALNEAKEAALASLVG